MYARSAPEQVQAGLLIGAREAASLLSICERSLWTYTKAGTIPHVRIGKAVRYSAEALQQWIQQNTKGGQN